MKKLIIATVALIAISFSASAQNQSVGGSLNFSSDIGLSARYTYEWSQLRLAPEFGMFFPEHGTVIDMNANLHYLFGLAPRFNLYPLAGFNVGIASYDGNSNSNFGLNLGAGGEYLFSNTLAGFVELKGVLGDGSRGQFSLGLAYRF